MEDITVKLRAIDVADCDLIYAYENDTSAWGDGVSTRFYSKYAIEQYIRTTQNDDAFISCQVRMMIDITNANGTFTVGCADLYDIDARHSKAGVGIYIDKRYRQNRYAQKAILQISDYAFKILNLHQLYAFVGKYNTPCNRAFASCGYVLTSTLKDWLKTAGRYIDVNVYQLFCNE